MLDPFSWGAAVIGLLKLAGAKAAVVAGGKAAAIKGAGVLAKAAAGKAAVAHGGMHGAAAAAKVATIKATGSTFLGNMAETATTEAIFAGATWPLAPTMARAVLAIEEGKPIKAVRHGANAVRTFAGALDDDDLAKTLLDGQGSNKSE